MRRLLLTIILLVATLVTWAAGQRFTVVIDAGHGGKDAGCVGAISKEKNLTLRYALALGRHIERQCPDVRVIYTRKTDVFLELWQRAEIANKNKANLFISVHINALPKGKIARGFQTYTLGVGRVSGSNRGIQENLEVAKRENSVIFMEKNYQQVYKGFDPNSPESNIMFEFIQDKNMERSVDLAKMMQRNVCAATGRQNMGAHQDNLAVLRLSSMPGCLLELGFISTADEEQFMNAESSTDRYVTGIFNAFMEYRRKYDTNIVIPYKAEQKEPAPVVENIVPESYREEKTPAAKPATTERHADKTAQTARAEEPQVPAAQPEKVAETPQAAPAATPQDRPVFKVQIIASSTIIKPGDPRLKGLEGVESYTEGGLRKYTYGASADYNEISRLRKEILAKFPQAFIVAFKNGERVNVNDAIREFKSNQAK